MKDRTKGIIAIALVIIFCIGAVLGYSYISQRHGMGQGIEYLEDGEYQKAYEEFEKAASKFSLGYTKQKVDSMYYEGESLYRLERYEDAISVYDSILKHKEAGYGYAMKALCYVGLEQEEKAVEICNQGITNCKTEGESYDVKIAILMKQKKYDQGLKVVKTALSQDLVSGKAQIMFDRISLYEGKLDYNTAYKYAKDYVKAYPKDKKGKKELTFLKSRI
ncbi:MAG: tetratricopeptide repeat protein [Anaerostipes sp.]|jgi:tetratricopeptide (TPR) repeat protein|nr:tetratricopeptide repeat protein [Anaerostipes sp.]